VPASLASALDVVRLLEALADGQGDGAGLGERTRAAAAAALAIVDRPADDFDPNRRFGFVHAVGFPRSSPFVAEAHALVDGRAPAGLAILFGADPGLFDANANLGRAPLATYRSLPFESRIAEGAGGNGWSTLFDACLTERGASGD